MFCSFCGERNSDSFRFCSSCGKSRESIAQPIIESDVEIVEAVLRPKGVVLALEDEKWDFKLCDVYKELIGAKYFDDVIFDAIFTTKRVLLKPVSKTPSHLWVLGALITPGLAQAADLMGKKVSSFLSETSGNLVGKSVAHQVLNFLPAWSNDSLFRVEYSLPSLMKSAGTALSFNAVSNVAAVSSKTRLDLVFEGSAVPSKKHFLEFPLIAKLCSFDVSRAKPF